MPADKQPAKSFEDLYCWQMARELTNKIYLLTRDRQQFSDWSLANQIQRASVSIMSNLAEGFERGTREDQIHFYYIAKASAGEVRCQAYIAFDQKYISQSELDEILAFCRRTSASIYRFIESVKVSKYKGLRFRNDKQRAEEKRKLEFYKQLHKHKLDHLIPSAYKDKI